jgi:hypothetical protein
VQKVYGIVFGLAVLVSAFGCERDLEYDLPTAAPRLVVNSLICEDSVLRIEISVSASPGDDSKIKSLKDAKIIVFENQTLVKDFVLDSLLTIPLDFEGNPIASVAPTKLFFYESTLSTAQSGRPYEIEVRYPGLATVNATAAVPRPARARTIPQTLNESIFVNGTPLDRLVFEIDDNGSSVNHYGLEILAYKPGSGEPAKKISFFSAEKAFSENLVVNTGQHEQGVFYRPENGVYFSNGKFKGRREQFEAYVDPAYLGPQYQLKLRVLTLSSDYFEFATSYQRQKLNANNPFAEPTQVYSNIDGGLGIFAGYSVTEALF